MKIMVTGDQGYIGSILVPMLMKRGYEVVGLDCGFFSENLLEKYDEQNIHVEARRSRTTMVVGGCQ